MKKRDRPLRLLLVEDNPDDAQIARMVFRKEPNPWEIVWVSDGQEALDFLFKRGKYADAEETWMPDLVLLNIMLPKVRGYEVLERLKQDPGLSLIPVVMWSISRSSNSIERSYRLGANAYLLKFASLREMKESLETVRRFWERVQLPTWVEELGWEGRREGMSQRQSSSGRWRGRSDSEGSLR